MQDEVSTVSTPESVVSTIADTELRAAEEAGRNTLARRYEQWSRASNAVVERYGIPGDAHDLF